MTQDALAQAAAVTRQTISSWEHGRTIPDIDTIRRLSAILDCNLLLSAGEQSELPVDGPSMDGQAAPAADGKRHNKKWWIIACAVVLACAVCLILFLYPRKSAPAGDGAAFDARYYRQETPNEPSQAYFTFDNQTWEEKSDTAVYQRYDFVMREQNGVGFSVTRVEAALEGVSGNVRPAILDADALKAAGLETEIPAFGSFHLDGGFPTGEFKQAGIAVYGNDANGAALTFYSLIEF